MLGEETAEERAVSRDALFARINKEIELKQGCRFTGFIEVQRVPGNFHIGHHAFGDIMQNLDRQGIKLDNSFKINHLSFGEKTRFSSIKSRFPDTDIQHPLDGYELSRKDNLDNKMRSLFSIKAVPSIFESDWGFGDWFASEVFQLNSHEEHRMEGSNENLIIFQYKVSPVAVRYSNHRENTAQFLINICAIIGGVFTIAGIVDSIIHKTSKLIFKESINKLS